MVEGAKLIIDGKPVDTLTSENGNRVTTLEPVPIDSTFELLLPIDEIDAILVGINRIRASGKTFDWL